LYNVVPLTVCIQHHDTKGLQPLYTVAFFMVPLYRANHNSIDASLDTSLASGHCILRDSQTYSTINKLLNEPGLKTATLVL
jgi:hypothetical protein